MLKILLFKTREIILLCSDSDLNGFDAFLLNISFIVSCFLNIVILLHHFLPVDETDRDLWLLLIHLLDHLLALGAAEPPLEAVVDQGGEEGEGGERGHGDREDGGQVPGGVIQREPEHEDRHPRVLDPSLDRDGDDVLALALTKLREEASEGKTQPGQGESNQSHLPCDQLDHKELRPDAADKDEDDEEEGHGL